MPDLTTTSNHLRAYAASELLQMLRQRIGIKQHELAALIALNSSRMVQSWEAGDSLPKAERLKRLIEVFYQRGAFIAGKEAFEARQLWQAVKDSFDTKSSRFISYPVFDSLWFEQLTHSSPVEPPAPLAEGALEPITPPPLDLVNAAKPEAVESKVVSNLPKSLNPIVGRKSEAEFLCAALRGSTRLLSLTGPGGVGKTRLALEVARELLEDYQGRVMLVDLSMLSQPDLLLPTIAKVLGLKEPPKLGEAALLQALSPVLAGLPMLLVLDNFEQLLSGATTLSALLQEFDQLRLLVTSRAVLQLYGEQEYRLAPLPLPPRENFKATSPEELENYPAIRLFIDRVQQVRPDFELQAELVPSVIAVCESLDGLPLALELAAAQVKLFSMSELARRLTQKLPLLANRNINVPDRQRTLNRTLSWSYDLLTPPEQGLFRQLGILVGGFQLETVVQLFESPAGQDNVEIVASLLDKSLLHVESRPDAVVRFAMLKTIQEFALEQLADTGELANLKIRMAEYFLKLATTYHEQLKGPTPKTILQQFADELDNWRAVLQWATRPATAWPEPTQQSNALATGSQLSYLLTDYWIARGYISEGRNWLDQLMSAAQSLPSELAVTKTAWYAKIVSIAGRLASLQGEQPLALQLLGQALELCETVGDELETAKVLVNIGASHARQGDFDSAIIYSQRGLELARRLNDQGETGRALQNMGANYQSLGDYEQALNYYQESLQLRRATQDQLAISQILNNMGMIAAHRCEYEEAHDLYQASLEAADKFGSREMTAHLYRNLALMSERRGYFAEAFSYYQQSLALHQKLNNKIEVSLVVRHLGNLARLQGQYQLAEVFLKQAMALSRVLDDKVGIATVLTFMAHLNKDQGRYAKAAELYQESYSLNQSLNDKISLGECLNGLGDIARLQNNLEEAQKLLTESLHMFWEGKLKFETLDCLQKLGLVYSALGQTDKAGYFLGAAASLGEELNTPAWVLSPTNAQLLENTQQANLTNPLFTAAWEKGRIMPLDRLVAGEFDPPQLAAGQTSSD